MSMRILLVNDDSEFRELVAEMLRRDGFVVIEAQSGIEALGHMGAARRAERRPSFDLIVYDDDVAVGSAFDLMAALRFTDEHVPVLLLEATRDAGRRHRARALPPAAILEKPFAMRELRALVGDSTDGPRPRVA